jgi:hypothetical protein
MHFLVRRLFVSTVLITIMTTSSFASPSLQGLFNTGVYTFTRSDTQDSTLFHSRLHQSMTLNTRDLFLKGSLLRTSGLFYMDPFNSFSEEPGFHIYTLSYQTEWFNRQLNINLGRQFVYSITQSRRIDGVYATFRRSSYHIKMFAGGYLPGLGAPSNLIADHLIGADFIWTYTPGLNIGVGLSELGRERKSYEAIRQGKETITVSSSASQRLGYQLNWSAKKISAYVRGRHDLFTSELQDFRTRLSYRGERLKSFSIEFSHREPQVLDNSIFSVFGGTASQEIRSNATVSINADMTSYLRVRHVQFDGDVSNMVSVGLSYKAYMLDLRHQNGYGGSYNHAILSTQHMMGKNRLYAKLNLGSFKLLEGESQDLATVLLGAHIPFKSKFQLSLESQLLRNKYYDYDARVYVGFRYRL